MYVSQVVSPQSIQDRLATVLAPKEFTLQLWRALVWEDLNIQWYYLYKAPQEQRGEKGIIGRGSMELTFEQSLERIKVFTRCLLNCCSSSSDNTPMGTEGDNVLSRCFSIRVADL